MLTAYSTRTISEIAYHNIFHAQIINTNGNCENIYYGIHCPYLMEMHLLKCTAMSLSFCLTQNSENPRCNITGII